MCFGSKNDKDEEGAAKNREIEKMIRQDEKKASREVKLLLLGNSSISRAICIPPSADKLQSRCWREWKVDSAEADAPDTHKGLPNR